MSLRHLPITNPNHDFLPNPNGRFPRLPHSLPVISVNLPENTKRFQALSNLINSHHPPPFLSGGCDNDIVLTGRRPVRPATGGFRLGHVEDVFIEGNRYRCAPGVNVLPKVEAAEAARGVVVRGNVLTRETE